MSIILHLVVNEVVHQVLRAEQQQDLLPKYEGNATTIHDQPVNHDRPVNNARLNFKL